MTYRCVLHHLPPRGHQSHRPLPCHDPPRFIPPPLGPCCSPSLSPLLSPLLSLYPSLVLPSSLPSSSPSSFTPSTLFTPSLSCCVESEILHGRPKTSNKPEPRWLQGRPCVQPLHLPRLLQGACVANVLLIAYSASDTRVLGVRPNSYKRGCSVDIMPYNGHPQCYGTYAI